MIDIDSKLSGSLPAADQMAGSRREGSIMKAIRVLSVVGLGVLGLGLTPDRVVAQAEDDDELSSLRIEEIIVTATRRESALMTTSIAVSAFSQEELTRNGVKDIRDASDLVPNFDVAFSPSDSGVQLTMRGINSNNFTEIGDPSVAFHVDGVYSPRPQGATALMFDLERLEVMRGPQGTLFGRNSAAGSVNVITAKPTTEGVFGTIGAELGNFNQRNMLGTLNVPITDTFALRGNFFIEKRDGFADQDSGTKDLAGIGNAGPDGIPDMDQRRNKRVQPSEYYGNADRWAARLAGQWEPTDRFSWYVAVETAEDNSAGWPVAPDCEKNPDLCKYNGGGIDYVDPNIPGLLDLTNDAVRTRVEYAVTDFIDAIYIGGWARQERRQEWDGDMGWRPVPGSTTGWLNRNQPWSSLYLATAESHYETNTHELQLQGLTGDVNWIVGLYRLEEDNDIIFDVEQPFCCSQGALGGISFIQPFRTVESEAIFGQATWHLSDRWHLTAGYRYYEDTKQDVGGRSVGCFGGGGCSFSGGQIPNDGFPQTPGATDELLLPQFTSADLGPGMGAFNRLGNYQVFDVNDNQESFSDGTWRIGLDYDLSADSFLYSYIATGSKAGSLSDGVDVCRCGRIEFFNYDPEEVTNYEIGYKGQLLDGRLNLIVTGFYTDYKNKQVSSFRTVGFVEDPLTGDPLLPLQEIGSFITDNAGGAEIKGIEVEWDFIPWENGRLTGGLGILDTEFTEWDGYAGEAYFCEDRADVGPEFACIPVDENQNGEFTPVGNELPYSTPLQLTVAYSHEIFLDNGGSVVPWVKLRYEDEMYFTEGNFDAIKSLAAKRPEIATLDATVRYNAPDGKWGIEAFMYNVTNERFPTYWVDANQPGAPLFTWNPPRSWGVRASWNLN
jgi:iron complex outermembrane receptor protein